MYLTTEELAVRYRVTPHQITKMARRGQIPGFKFGKLWRFRKSDIAAWESRHIVIDSIEQIVNGIVGP